MDNELVNTSQTIDQTAEPQEVENIQLEVNAVDESTYSSVVNKDASFVELEGEIVKA